MDDLLVVLAFWALGAMLVIALDVLFPHESPTRGPDPPRRALAGCPLSP